MLKIYILIGLFIGWLNVCAQSGMGILENHFQAHGQDEWNQVRTLSVDGKWHDAIDQASYPMKLTWKRPDKVHLVARMKGMRHTEGYNGLVGWLRTAGKEADVARRMTDEEELMTRNVFTAGSPLYETREHLEFTGLMDMEGTLYNTFTLNEGDFRRVFYLDRISHRLVYELMENQFGKEKVTVLKVIDVYKTYGPMLVPAAVILEGPTIEREYVFDEIYLGMGAKDALFDYPQGQ